MKSPIVIALLLVPSAAVLAHPGPRIWVGSEAGQIFTYSSDNDVSPTTYTPSRVFGAELEDLVPGAGVFTTTFPGYEAKKTDAGLPSGTVIGFNIAGPLLRFDEASASFEPTAAPATPGAATQLAVSSGATVRVTGDAPASGFDFFTYNATGDHAHLSYTLYGDGSGASDGASGVYALPLELTSASLSTSPVYYLLLGKDVEQDSALFGTAADVARTTLVPEPASMTLLLALGGGASLVRRRR